MWQTQFEYAKKTKCDKLNNATNQIGGMQALLFELGMSPYDIAYKVCRPITL